MCFLLELVKTASEFRSSLENQKNRRFTEIERLRAEKICKLDVDMLRLNYHGDHDHSGKLSSLFIGSDISSVYFNICIKVCICFVGLLNAKLDDLHQFLDDIMTKWSLAYLYQDQLYMTIMMLL